MMSKPHLRHLPLWFAHQSVRWEARWRRGGRTYYALGDTMRVAYDRLIAEIHLDEMA